MIFFFWFYGTFLCNYLLHLKPNKRSFCSIAYLYLSQVSLLPLFFQLRMLTMKNKNYFALPTKQKPNNAGTELTSYIQNETLHD